MLARRPLAPLLFTMPETYAGFLRQRVSQQALQDVAGRPATTRADFSRLPGDCGAARPTICGSDSALQALELDFFQARLAHTMMGLNIRVGLEDSCWRHPNGDELLKSNLELFTRARKIAAELGRRPATADEYRTQIGLATRAATDRDQ